MKSLATKLIRFVFIFLFLITCINSYATEVPQDKAKLVATNYLRQLTNQPLKRSGDLVKLVYTSKPSTSKRTISAPLFYVFNQVEGKGFIIVSGDDNIKPILGYSLESNFDQDNLSPQVAYWLSEYEKQISYVVESNVQNTLEKQQFSTLRGGHGQHQPRSQRPNDPGVPRTPDAGPLGRAAQCAIQRRKHLRRSALHQEPPNDQAACRSCATIP